MKRQEFIFFTFQKVVWDDRSQRNYSGIESFLEIDIEAS